jgi:hypothetical protein
MNALEVLNGGAISDPGVGPTPPGECGSDEIFVVIKLTTDDNAAETNLALTHSGGAALVTLSNLANNQVYVESQCVPAHDCYTFTITDSEDNGICCGYGQGSFEVNVEGQPVGGGGEFGSEDSFSFGQCAPPSVDIGLSLRTDNYPGETVVTLTDKSTGQRFWYYGFSEANKSYNLNTTMDPSSCYVFEVTDSYGDGVCCQYGQGGFDLSYDGLVVRSGGAFGSSDIYELGEGC